ncbi:MAG: zinc ribbon domain-containing protein [Chitinispirillia bacterium]|nr:zinc ribbon domain-containing protein [Chitinispirillia bacterium]
MKNNASFVCPVCGAVLPANAKVCRDCGSDDTTGWSENTYLDGIGLPFDDDEYEDMKKKEFGEVNVSGKAGSRIDWKMVIGIIVLVAMIYAIVAR